MRLARRTALLSQAKLGSREAAERYINFLKNSYRETDANAGFHLEYYLDQPLDVRMPPCSGDGAGNASNTIRIFKESLDSQTSDRKKLSDNPIILIEIYTLTSILARRVFTDRFASEIHAALPVLLDAAKFAEDEDISIFVSLLADAASSRDSSFAAREIGKFYSTKNTPRNVRGIGFLECIGSHAASSIWLCNLIPKNIGGVKIERIKRMLEIHDLAEGITGHIPEPEKPKSQEQEERKLMRRLSWLGLYSNPAIDSFDFYSLYSEFKEKSTSEAKIANDLDMVDVVIQCDSLLKTEADMGRSAILSFRNNAEKNITTEQGKSVLGIVKNFNLISEDSFRGPKD